MKAIDFRRSFRYLAVLCAVACGIGAVARGATSKTNPVTGETEEYTNTFTGDTAEWNLADNWDTASVPFVSGGNYDPALVDGKTVSTSTAVDGWTLRVGAYNGANITWSGGISKIQAGSAGCWLTVDATSSITIASFGGNQLEGSSSAPFKLSSASAGGITWQSGLTSASNTTLPFWYYLKGDGTVVYGGDITVANAQVIKQADITLSGSAKSIKSKTLVTFGTGTTKTFGADAAIKIKNGDDVLKTVYLTSVTAAESTALTTENDVGTCELVQTSSGVDLYWVDGDPADIVDEEKTYLPSININFTSGTDLSTAADVGIGDYAIPGTSWNNLIGNNGSLTTLKGVVDSTGASSTISGASVTISGTRGYWTRSDLYAESDLRQAYIDDADGNASPQFVVEGIPYYSYKVVLYFSNDTNGRPFGHLTVNGTNYRWDSENSEIVTCDGVEADCWGSSDSTAYTEGGNYLVFPVMMNTDGTLTVVGHRWSGTKRAGLAAVQIIEVKAEIGEDDLEIPVSGDTTYTVDETKSYNKVYIIGSGTLTLDGTGKITANEAIYLSGAVTLNANADRLDGTFTGAGTVAYDGVVPPTGKGWTDSSSWGGTVWIKNKAGITGNNNASTGVQPNSLGNANSKVKFSGVSGWLEAPIEYTPEIVLENDSYDYALQLTNGNSPNSTSDANNNRATIIKKLSGSGTLSCGGTSSAVPTLKVYDASEFTGSIDTGSSNTGLVVVFCDEDTVLPDTLVEMFINSGLKRTIYIASGKVMTLDSSATWTANTGFVINGTLNANGTLASSHATKAVSGTGTVVFAGKLPSPTGDAWWKNSAWDGTVQIKSATFTGVGGVATYLEVNKYGNSESILELNNCSGWLPVGNTSGDNVCAVPLKITGMLTINDGYSNRQFTINKLIGSGSIYTTSNGATVTIQVKEADDFTGYVQLNSKRVIFGETIPTTFTSGQIYVGNGFSFTVPNSDSAWYGTGGIVLDGELKATALSNFGGGTNITTTDNGVFEFINSNNTEDQGVDYARITGTGTLRYADVSGKWRALSTVNFPTNMICENNLSSGLICTSYGGTDTIGSLSGSGQIRSDWSNGNRDLRILQAKDTTYSGLFASSNDRIANVIVASGESTGGILTLSGKQTASNALTVESGAGVNITGTWVGNATVSGAFGGSGTLTGALTFNEGASLKAYDGNDTGIAVSGSITFPANGKVVIDTSSLPATTDKVGLINKTDLDVSKFEMQENSGYIATLVGESDFQLFAGNVSVIVPEVEHALAIVKVDGIIVMPSSDGTYSVPLGAEVSVKYEPEDGYSLNIVTEYTISEASSNATVELQNIVALSGLKASFAAAPASTEDETEKGFVAKIEDAEFETFEAAVEAAQEGDVIKLFADAEYLFSAGIVLKIDLNGYEFTPLVDDEDTQVVIQNEEEGVVTYTFAFRALGDEVTISASSDADEEEIASLVFVAPPSDEVAALVSPEEYDSYFVKSATFVPAQTKFATRGPAEGTWSVSIALDSTKVLPSEETENAAMLNAVISLATGESIEAIVPTKSGLYYWLAATTDLGGEYLNGEPVLGDGSNKALSKPADLKDDTKAFYKICVAPLPPK